MEKHNIPQAKQPYGCHTIHWEYNKIIQLVVLEIKQQVVRDRILVYGLATNIQVGYSTIRLLHYMKPLKGGLRKNKRGGLIT